MSCNERFACLHISPGPGSLELCISEKFVWLSACYGPSLLAPSENMITMTTSIKTNRIMALHTPEVSNMLEDEMTTWNL